MIEPKFNESEGILYVEVNGKIGLQEMLASSKNLKQLSQLAKNLKILEDARNVIIDFQVSDIPQLVHNFEKNIDVFDSVRHAVIHSDPLGTAYTMLVTHFNKMKKYSIMAFSTEEAAKNWLING